MNPFSSFGAKLKDEENIEVIVAKSYNSQGCLKFYLYDGDKLVGELEIVSKSYSSKYITYQLFNPYTLCLGRDYYIMDERNISIDLDVSRLMQLDKFVDRLYSNEKMGSSYSKKGTTFRIFSPIASSGIVMIQNKEKKIFESTPLVKNDKTGVFEGYAKGDFTSHNYFYLLKINNRFEKVMDPYSYAVTLLSHSSVIVNPKDVEVDLNLDKLKPFGTINDAIIYETSVRDITSDLNTNIVNKGKFLGLTEEGIKTHNGNPVGIDYLKSLGVTHVQLLPIYDFQTTNDLHPEDTYNWGYDPCNFCSPEGSFSTKPDDPLNRIIELKMLISKLHENNIRVVMDVVFNHVFNMETSSFEQACPNYYFKYNQDGI